MGGSLQVLKVARPVTTTTTTAKKRSKIDVMLNFISYGVVILNNKNIKQILITKEGLAGNAHLSLTTRD